jgi:hypothetical protein
MDATIGIPYKLISQELDVGKTIAGNNIININ